MEPKNDRFRLYNVFQIHVIDIATSLPRVIVQVQFYIKFHFNITTLKPECTIEEKNIAKRRLKIQFPNMLQDIKSPISSHASSCSIIVRISIYCAFI